MSAAVAPSRSILHFFMGGSGHAKRNRIVMYSLAAGLQLPSKADTDSIFSLQVWIPHTHISSLCSDIWQHHSSSSFNGILPVHSPPCHTDLRQQVSQWAFHDGFLH